MTDDRMVLIDLIEKSADTDLVREMLSFAAERLMEAEVEARTGARCPRPCTAGAAQRLSRAALGHARRPD
jgi:hypothetical protein